MKHPTEKHVRETHRRAIAAKDFGVMAAIESLYLELKRHIEYYPSKIYASKPYSSIYKLHQITNNKWMFCQIDTSEGGSSGKHNTPEKAIKAELRIGKVEVFDNRKEFLKWALKKTS